MVTFDSVYNFLQRGWNYRTCLLLSPDNHGIRFSGCSCTWFGLSRMQWRRDDRGAGHTRSCCRRSLRSDYPLPVSIMLVKLPGAILRFFFATQGWHVAPMGWNFMWRSTPPRQISPRWCMGGACSPKTGIMKFRPLGGAQRMLKLKMW